MTRLVTFGCSNTFGVALPDVWDYKKQQQINEHGPSKYAWPQLLADRLNLECVNLGIPGASNKEIWHTIVNIEFHQTDIVIILWTWYDRWCVLDKKQNNYEITQSFTTHKLPYTTYDMVLDFYLRCNHIETLLKDKVKIIKHGTQQVLPENPQSLMYDSNINIVPNWNKIINFLNVSFAHIRLNCPVALDNIHPGPEAHKIFATAIYADILSSIEPLKEEDPFIYD